MAGERWREAPLDSLTETPITYGVVKPGGHDDATGVKFIRAGDIANGRILVEQLRTVTRRVSAQYARTLLRGGELLVSLVGNPGQVAIAPASLKDANIARQVGLVRLNAGVDTRFVKYFLLSPAGQGSLGAHSRGSVQQVINLRDLKTVKIPLPPLSEQRRIAHILGPLDDKIELNRRMNRTLESMARSIFKSWFVDFDPVRAKAAGQPPPGLKPELAALFPDAFQDSELGQIPKGWRVGRVDDLAHINARTLGRRDTLGIIDYVEISEVMRGEVGTITRYTRGEEPSRARRCLQHGDTVLSTVRPDRGAYFLTLYPTESLIASTGFAVLTPKDGNWAFLHAATTQPGFGEELGRLADGGAYPAIRAEVVGGRELPIPECPQLTAAFDRVAQPLFLKANANRRLCSTLAALRDTLLPKLISGELRVPDAERIVGRVV